MRTIDPRLCQLRTYLLDYSAVIGARLPACHIALFRCLFRFVTYVADKGLLGQCCHGCGDCQYGRDRCLYLVGVPVVSHRINGRYYVAMGARWSLRAVRRTLLR